MKIKFSLPVLLLVSLCGCATYHKQPWTEAIYEKGNVYILDGTETLKTANLMTVDGTFKYFTFPVKRDFKVYRYSDKSVIYTNVIQKSDDCDQSYYDYFSDENTLVVCNEGRGGEIHNFNTGMSVDPNGDFANFRQAQCKYALIWRPYHKPEEYLVYDKLTGKSTKLTSNALAFIGKIWEPLESELFLSEDGTKLFRSAGSWDSKQKQFSFVVAVWDLAQDKLLMKSPVILFSEKQFRGPGVQYAEMSGDKLFILFRGSLSDSTGCVIKDAIVTPTGYEVKDLYSMDEFMPLVKVVPDDSETATIFGRIFDKDHQITKRTDRIWRLIQFNLKTGACLHQETISLPGQPAP